ncbi:polyhydroxyalkanoic acid system protein [Azorhizobium oxalatiphilum]|uniref:Polyhydroxyalkanoic acid system protein n=1 Tax=Azorhizobium oxalatiphilum TaxID=980631 RepID=A0A917CAK3_9HYPH|nr:polyhydroxyalkanoic acid system family protein [Azorhizobium oxalatiphilum]GGF76726.1 polyhydroxyalkanoic acid system protein [Azorhizobium oxalatiphilum]
MAAPFTCSVPHKLGRDEAVRRIQEGAAHLREKYGDKVEIREETWTDAHVDFRVAAMGFEVPGQMDVAEDQVHLTLELPGFLSLAAGKIRDVVQKQGTLLLEKK